MKNTVLCILFLATGVVFSQDLNQFDADGKRHGVWKKNFEGTSQVRYEGQFDHGKEIGLFKFYKLIRKKSSLTATKQFNDVNNSADVKFYTSRGKVISEGKMDGKRYVGKWVYYHKNSNEIMTAENYNDNGVLHGERLVYYKNGHLAEQANYVDGKLEGVSQWYSEKDVVLKSFIYENDELHGIAKNYNLKGELLSEGYYKRGKKTGIWKYYANGKLIKEKDFNYKRKSRNKQ